MAMLQPRTVLASATITESTLRLLGTLFGQPGPFLQVSAPVARPEPVYWVAGTTSARARADRLLEGAAAPATSRDRLHHPAG